MKKILFATPVDDFIPSIGLLIFRLVFGGMMLIGHGWGKLMAFGEKSATFPDPLGIGNELSMGGAILGEAVCAALVMLGITTRIAVIPLVFTMGIAAFVVHGGDPFFMGGSGGAKEPALVYLFSFALLGFTGPGAFSFDHCLNKK